MNANCPCANPPRPKNIWGSGLTAARLRNFGTVVGANVCVRRPLEVKRKSQRGWTG
jgi:hypothetical protein